MAKFNTDLPDTQDPSYIGISRGTANPNVNVNAPGFPKVDAPNVPDVSSGNFMKNLAGAFETAVKGVDSTIKADIEETAYKQVDEQRDAYTKQLKQQLAVGNIKGLSGVSTGSTSDDDDMEFSSQNRKMPSDLENLPRTAQTLAQAKESGALMSVDYTARVTKLAKEMRAKYPGYREYIDQTFSQATGMNMANAEVRSLATAVRAQQVAAAAGDKDVKRMLFEALQFPGGEDVYKGYSSGALDRDDVANFYSRYKQQQWTTDQEVKSLNIIEKKGKVRDDMIERNLDSVINNEVSNFFNNFQLKTKAFAGETLTSLLGKASRGEIAIDAVESRKTGEALMQGKVVAEQAIMRELQKNGYLDGPNKASPETIRKKIDAGLKQFDAVAESFYNPNYGKAFSDANESIARGDQFKKRALQDETTAEVLLMGELLQKSGGPEYSQNFFKQLLGTNAPEHIKSVMKNKLLKNITQPNAERTGVPQTWNDTIAEIKNRAKEAGMPEIKDPKNIEMVIDAAKSLADPKTPDGIRENLILSTYHPRNKDFLRNFETDTFDPQNPSRRIKGKYGVFNDLTSPKMIAAVREASKDRPELWNYAKNWTEESFRTLYNDDMKSLENLPARPGVRVGWDSGNNRFGLYAKGEDGAERNILNEQTNLRERMRAQSGDRPMPNVLGGIQGDPGLAQTKQVLNRLNYGLGNMVNMAKAQNLDADTYLINLIAQGSSTDLFSVREQGDLNLRDVQKISNMSVSIPQQIFQSLYSPRLKQRGEELERQRAKSAPRTPGFE